MTPEQVRRAVGALSPAEDFVWDGKDEDERPATPEELAAGLKRVRGRPAGGTKASTTIRLDRDVLDAFRAGGPGWQTRINDVLRAWLEAHGRR